MAVPSENSNVNNLLQRHLSVHFSTKFIKGITHEEVLNQTENVIDKSQIKAIQITEKDCVITVSEPIAKAKLVVKGINIKNFHINIYDVEKQVTNLTIKDAPVELNDHVLCAYIRQYGQIVDGSMKRGTIKGTDIETGTRYVQLLNCIPIIPNNTFFGRFNVRLFADNNRTQCRHCGLTDHPSFKCEKKQKTSTKTCLDAAVKNMSSKTVLTVKTFVSTAAKRDT